MKEAEQIKDVAKQIKKSLTTEWYAAYQYN